MSNRHGPINQNCPPELHPAGQPQHHPQSQPAQQSQALQSHHHQQPVEYYQKHTDISEKNYHHPNVIGGAGCPDNYAKKESYNFVASPNLLQQQQHHHHPDNVRMSGGDDSNYTKYKPNYNRELGNIRGDHHNIYNSKRDHYAALVGAAGAPSLPPQIQPNYHRENFNITENPNLINSRDNYNIRENFTSMENCNVQPSSRGRAGNDQMRNQFNNNYATRENEPLLHAAPVAKVSMRQRVARFCRTA